MKFIETLQAVGGVKPCHECAGKGMKVERTGSMVTFATNSFPCEVCHGTGQILDLAPLLAKPSALRGIVRDLCDGMGYKDLPVFATWTVGDTVLSGRPGFYVVSPQRSASLAYALADCLDGTAVVAIPQGEYHEEVKARTDIEASTQGSGEMQQEKESSQDHKGRTKLAVGYRLSLPIPPDATVLFVTDKFDRQEVLKLIDVVATEKILPYVLCLISSEDTVDGKWKVISLHQEKP